MRKTKLNFPIFSYFFSIFQIFQCGFAPRGLIIYILQSKLTNYGALCEWITGVTSWTSANWIMIASMTNGSDTT